MRSVRYFMLDFSSAWSDLTCSRIFVSISTIGSGFGASAFAASVDGRYGRGRRGNISCSCAVLYAHAASTCAPSFRRSEEHTSELQSRLHLVCRLLLEKKKKQKCQMTPVKNKKN